jgi:hypothetical protein
MKNGRNNQNSKIVTLYTFNNPLPVEKNILGQSFEFLTKTLSGFVFFPILPLNFVEKYYNLKQKNLLNPKECFIKNASDWGEYLPEGNAYVKMCYLEFQINNDLQSNESNNDIFKKHFIENELNFYFNKLIFVIEYLSMISIQANTFNKMKQLSSLNFYNLDENGECSLIGNPEVKFLINLPKFNPITLEKISYSFEKTNTNLVLKNYHIFLRNGMCDFTLNEYKSSIINICTSIELCFTDILLKSYNNNPENLKKLEMDEYRGLVGRYKLLKKVIKLPFTGFMYSQHIGNIRNKTVHCGYTPNKSECKKAIDMAYETINRVDSF